MRYSVRSVLGLRVIEYLPDKGGVRRLPQRWQAIAEATWWCLRFARVSLRQLVHWSSSQTGCPVVPGSPTA
eukprot:9956522-Alexandrium_andersonii.AAC.1